MLDYDYYKRKMADLTARPPKDPNKLTRNADKLRLCEATFLNVRNELTARLTALLAERSDFACAPLLQLLHFQQSFYSNMNNAIRPLAAFTFDSALLDAEARQVARQTMRSDAIADPVEPKPIEHYMAQIRSLPTSPAATLQRLDLSRPEGTSCALGCMSAQGATSSAPAPPPGQPLTGAGDSMFPSQLPRGAVPPQTLGTASTPAGKVAPPACPPPLPPRPAHPAASLVPKGERMRAFGDYAATDPRMISFNTGDVLYKEREEGGWLFGTNGRGQQGYFPASYVEKA